MRAKEPRPATLGRHDPSLTAILFRCGGTYVLEACSWPLKLALYAFQRQQMSHDQLPFEDTIRPSLPFCFGVAARGRGGF